MTNANKLKLNKEEYKSFIDWIKQNMAQPDRNLVFQSNDFMSLIKATYTDEEAALLTGIPLTFGMPFSGTEIKEIAKSKNMKIEVLSKKLDSLAKKGLVYRAVHAGTTMYSLFDPISIYVRSIFWPGRKDEWSMNLAPLVNQLYYNGLFDVFKDVDTKLAKVIPIQAVIEKKSRIIPYEILDNILETIDYFSVATCACRHRKNIDPDFPNCEYTTETCLHFGELAHYIVDNGLGREIECNEAKDILFRCAELGLVHQVSAWRENVDTICNCCKDCCVWLESFIKLKHRIGYFPSNYHVMINSESCIGCGTCIKRCPLGVLHLEDIPDHKHSINGLRPYNNNERTKSQKNNRKAAVLKPDLCIGCGVCAYKCPSNSLFLKVRENIHVPPETATELSIMLLNEILANKRTTT
jgi:NAD-dependent dihydropyrimidine dehydrogenase PreA subunit